MKHTFSANGEHENGPLPTKTAIVNATGTWGSGTLTISAYDAGVNEWCAVHTATADFKQEVTIGKGRKYKLALSGATAPSLVIRVLELEE